MNALDVLIPTDQCAYVPAPDSDVRPPGACLAARLIDHGPALGVWSKDPAWAVRFMSWAEPRDAGGDTACDEPSPRDRYIAALRWAATWSRLHDRFTGRLVHALELGVAPSLLRHAHDRCGRALARACEARRRAFDAAVVAAMSGGR